MPDSRAIASGFARVWRAEGEPERTPRRRRRCLHSPAASCAIYRDARLYARTLAPPRGRRRRARTARTSSGGTTTRASSARRSTRPAPRAPASSPSRPSRCAAPWHVRRGLNVPATQIELAGVYDAVSSPLVGRMRMQFWRDAVASVAEARVPVLFIHRLSLTPRRASRCATLSRSRCTTRTSTRACRCTSSGVSSTRGCVRCVEEGAETDGARRRPSSRTRRT
jgi:hypothetical protein